MNNISSGDLTQSYVIKTSIGFDIFKCSLSIVISSAIHYWSDVLLEISADQLVSSIAKTNDTVIVQTVCK